MKNFRKEAMKLYAELMRSSLPESMLADALKDAYLSGQIMMRKKAANEIISNPGICMTRSDLSLAILNIKIEEHEP
jgi:hypothetical protein